MILKKLRETQGSLRLLREVSSHSGKFLVTQESFFDSKSGNPGLNFKLFKKRVLNVKRTTLNLKIFYLC